jgi:hypothetical protein
MPQEYSLTIVNDSAENVTGCLYQTEPESSIEGARSLAWFAQSLGAGTTTRFRWTEDYCFVWAPTPSLQPGAVFRAAQLWPADLETMSQVTFTSESGALMFIDPATGPFPDSFVIVETDRIPVETAAVGIGMSNAPTIAVQAAPGTTLIFTPNPQYWFTTGDYVAGEVLDEEIADKLRIDYPANVFSLELVIMPDGTFRLRPTEEQS